jgi:hypothetical protein
MALPPDSDYACVVDGVEGWLTVDSGHARLAESPRSDPGPVVVRLLG